jgi:hypothetical protein
LIDLEEALRQALLQKSEGLIRVGPLGEGPDEGDGADLLRARDDALGGDLMDLLNQRRGARADGGLEAESGRPRDLEEALAGVGNGSEGHRAQAAVGTEERNGHHGFRILWAEREA